MNIQGQTTKLLSAWVKPLLHNVATQYKYDLYFQWFILPNPLSILVSAQPFTKAFNQFSKIQFHCAFWRPWYFQDKLCFAFSKPKIEPSSTSATLTEPILFGFNRGVARGQHILPYQVFLVTECCRFFINSALNWHKLTFSNGTVASLV